MSGYAGFSMSNNAVAAYRDGLAPASKIGRVPASLVEQFCTPREWHHSSKHFNRVNFYDPTEVLAIFGIEPHDDYEPNPAAIAALAAHRASRKNAPAVHERCIVRWLDWSGTRNHPHCDERQAEDCRVEVKGKTATVTTPTGQKFTKRLSTRGFSFKVQG